MADFIVDRSNIKNTQVVLEDTPTVTPGQALLKIEKFALTANNITYGVAGDLIGYWKFFPAIDGWGKIPVWGIACVADANDTELEVGDRYYGYFPMSDHLVVEPVNVSPRGFVDGVAHRKELPVVYNQYSLMNEANGFDPKLDNHKMVYAPLFTTSFILDDYFIDNDDFGAECIVLGSASSKTAFGMAFQLKQANRLKVVGLTSKGNLGFVKSLNLYDEVVSYDEIESLDSSLKTAYIDMSGNRTVLSSIHRHFSDQLVNSTAVGITHWEAREGDDLASLPGVKPSMFFAPTQIVKRNQDWGPQEYQSKLRQATDSFLAQVDDWVTIKEYSFDNVSDVYVEVLNGAAPNKALVVKMEN